MRKLRKDIEALLARAPKLSKAARKDRLDKLLERYEARTLAVFESIRDEINESYVTAEKAILTLDAATERGENRLDKAILKHTQHGCGNTAKR